jgi:hypothetical protein
MTAAWPAGLAAAQPSQADPPPQREQRVVNHCGEEGGQVLGDPADSQTNIGR